MNKEQKKNEINSKRFDYLKKIAKLYQAEVDRCYAMIDKAQNQEQMDVVQFIAPPIPEI